MPKYDPEYFKEKFPELHKEIKKGAKTIEINGVRSEEKEGKKAAEKEDKKGPNIVDFLRLCDDEDEALEIINYMEDKEKIELEYARELRSQLTHSGLRSFGSKRKPGEYSFNEKDDE